jgi:hypothetical protein
MRGAACWRNLQGGVGMKEQNVRNKMRETKCEEQNVRKEKGSVKSYGNFKHDNSARIKKPPDHHPQLKLALTCAVTPMNAWGFAAARIASTATPTPPSVPFLKPMGKDEPL